MKGIGTKNLDAELPYKIKENDEVIKESIYNIITTRKGERVGNPEFGTTIHKFLFELNIEFYWAALKLELAKDIESQDNRIKILDILLVPDVDNHKVSLYILYLNLASSKVQQLLVKNITE